MAISKAILSLPKAPPPPPNRQDQIDRFTQRIEKFIDIHLKEGKRIIPFCTFPKFHPGSLTEVEALHVATVLQERYATAEWKIDKVTVEHVDYGKHSQETAWEFS